MSHEPQCKLCARYGEGVSLERDPGGNWACPSCGMIDQSVTDNVNFVETSAIFGSIVNVETIRNRDVFETDPAQLKFNEGVLALLNLYLGIPSRGTAIVQVRGGSLRSGARQWFERMREEEQKLHDRMHKAKNPGARRMKYFAAVAIKLAAQESALTVLNNHLDEMGVKRKKRTLPMYTKGDENVHNPQLKDMFFRANTFAEDSFGHMDSFEYLKAMYNRYSRLVKFVITPVETLLLFVNEISARLRFIVQLPHEERQKILTTRPALSKNRTRPWIPEDFSWFENMDWDQVIPHAHNLYQMQETCRLWNTNSTTSVAIALALWAFQSVNRSLLPQYSSIQREMASFYNRTQWTTAEKFRDMRNLIIAWSTSITEAGIPFPVMPVPSKGGFGDGITGYNGDSRRPIPEIDLAVAALPVVVANWPKIVKARLKYRVSVMTLEDEMWLARKMFVVSAGIYHYRQVPLLSAQQSKRIRKTKDGLPKSRISNRYRLHAEEARKAIEEFEPLKRARTVPAQGIIFNPMGGLLPQYNTNLPAKSSFSQPQSPMQTPPQLQARPHLDMSTFVPPPPEKTIEDLIARTDDSSDEYTSDGYSDDDDTLSAPASSGLALINANAQASASQRPFAFTIGPNGFNTETQPQPPAHIVRTAHHQIDSASNLSPSSMLMARQPSIESQTGTGSASEAESSIPHPHSQLTISQLLNTPSPASSAAGLSPSPSQSGHPLTSTGASASTPGASSAGSTVGLRAPIEEPHVGLLVREKQEYVQFRLPHYRVSGDIVTTEVEAEMWKWIRAQVNNGTMPKKINAAYLRLIGIYGDPRKLDLGRWLRMKKEKANWSYVESLLRAGIKPREIPVHHIPHSVTHVRQLLYHHPDDGTLAPIGKAIDAEQLDKELDILCTQAGFDAPSEFLLSEKERHIRRERYKRSGAWDVTEKEKRSRSRSARASTVVPEQEDEDDLDFDVGDEGRDDSEFEATPGLSETPTRGSSLSRSEADQTSRSFYNPCLGRIRQTIRHSVSQIRTRSDGLDGLMRLMRELKPGGDDELLDHVDWSEEVWGVLDFKELGLEGELGQDEEVDGEAGEDEDDGNAKGKGKKKAAGTGTPAKGTKRKTVGDEATPRKRAKQGTQPEPEPEPSIDSAELTTIHQWNSQAQGMMPPPPLTGFQ